MEDHTGQWKGPRLKNRWLMKVCCNQPTTEKSVSKIRDCPLNCIFHWRISCLPKAKLLSCRYENSDKILSKTILLQLAKEETKKKKAAQTYSRSLWLHGGKLWFKSSKSAAKLFFPLVCFNVLCCPICFPPSVNPLELLSEEETCLYISPTTHDSL